MIDKEQLDRIEAKLDALILLVSARGIGGPHRPGPIPQPAVAPTYAQQPPAYVPPQQPAQAPSGFSSSSAAGGYAPMQQAYAPPARPTPPSPAPAPAPSPTPAPAPIVYRPFSPQALAQNPPPEQPVASDEDLDGKYGNPEVRKDPSRWKGESMVGRKYSECPPEFLDVLAALCDWRAEQDEKKGDARSKWARLDALRARGWAKRMRTGATSSAVEASFGMPPGFGTTAPARPAPRAPLIAPGENPDAEPEDPITDASPDDVPF